MAGFGNRRQDIRSPPSNYRLGWDVQLAAGLPQSFGKGQMTEFGLRAFRRTWFVAALFIAVIGVALVLAPTAQGQASFGVGSGRAEAKFVKVGPSRGSLTLAPQVGLALSDFLNTRGRGDVRTVDFAALEDSIPPEVVAGLPSVKVESTDEGSEEGRTVAVGAPPEVPVRVDVAELHANAGDAPYGFSSFKAGSIDVGVGTVVGGRAEARSGIVDGNVREATARVVVPRLELAEGAIVLEGMEWLVVNRSGAVQAEEATFNLGAVTIAGQSFRPPAGSEQPLVDVAAALEPVLGPLGIEITFPAPRIEAGVVELSPLRLRVANSELATVVNPVLEAVQPVREALVDAIRSGSEDVDAAILLSDVALGVLAGGSTLDIEIGGVRAFTAEPAEGFSFGSFDLSPPPSGAALDVSGGLPAPSSGTTGTGSVASETASGDTGAPSRQGDGDDVGSALASGASSRVAERGGPLLAVGLIGAAAAASTGAADYRRLRSGRRAIPVRV